VWALNCLLITGAPSQSGRESSKQPAPEAKQGKVATQSAATTSDTTPGCHFFWVRMLQIFNFDGKIDYVWLHVNISPVNHNNFLHQLSVLANFRAPFYASTMLNLQSKPD